jgi:DNA-binding Xre family transcriptional regulator
MAGFTWEAVMLISWRLKALLNEHRLQGHGVVQRISNEAGIHRTTVSNIYHDKAPNISLETLGKLCEWLKKERVPESKLPGALLEKRPAALWKALAGPGDMTIYLGEYLLADSPVPALRWVARRDAHVATCIIEKVSDASQVGSDPPRVHMRYVPFHKVYGERSPDEDEFEKDVAESARVYREMQENLCRSSAVMIGSAHINYQVEHFIADLCACEPFTRPRGSPAAPFFRVYRSDESDLPSCCGGPILPGDGRKSSQPGIYYRDKSHKWNLLPWSAKGDDAAVIITRFDRRTGELVLLIMGYSGRATAAAGSNVVQHPDLYWSAPSSRDPAIQTKIHICRVEFEGETPPVHQADPEVRKFEKVATIEPARVQARSL